MAEPRLADSAAPVSGRDPAKALAPRIFLLLGLLLGYFSSSLLHSHQNSILPLNPPVSSASIPQDLTGQSPKSTMPGNSPVDERTFIAIKPDGVQRGLVGAIISRFEGRGLKLVAMKLVIAEEKLLETHYAEHKDRPFFKPLIKYMRSGPICAMVWEGRQAVKIGRSIIGPTVPHEAPPGTIRGDYAIDTGRNVCHGSDTVENAKKEIKLWFPNEDEKAEWTSSQLGMFTSCNCHLSRRRPYDATGREGSQGWTGPTGPA